MKIKDVVTKRGLNIPIAGIFSSLTVPEQTAVSTRDIYRGCENLQSNPFAVFPEPRKKKKKKK